MASRTRACAFVQALGQEAIRLLDMAVQRTRHTAQSVVVVETDPSFTLQRPEFSQGELQQWQPPGALAGLTRDGLGPDPGA